MSAKSKGYDEKLLDGYTVEFMPDVLVEEIKADNTCLKKAKEIYLKKENI